MKKLSFGVNVLSILTCLLFLFSACGGGKQADEKKGTAIITYIEGGKSLDVNKITADKVTHINYAFADVKDNKAFLANKETDIENLKKLNTLKESNPNLKIVISIACREWSKTFSGSAAIDTKAFAKSVIDIIKDHDLDGADINWGYPMAKNSKDIIDNADYPQNYINTIHSIKNGLIALEKDNNKKYTLSCTIGTSPSDGPNTFIDKAQDALDYINLITYNYQDDKIAIHQSGLYSSDKHNAQEATSIAVDKYIKTNGIDPEKVVIGIPFYGCVYKMKKNSETGIGDPIIEKLENKGYTYIKDSLVNKNEYYRYWDNPAQAPYVYNFYKSILVTYDDEESVKAKCQYIKDNNLAGVMIWKYDDDPKGYLLNTINQALIK